MARAIDARTLESTYYGAARRWFLSRNVEQLPKLSAPGFPLLETLHNLALEESLANVRPDGAFMAGAKWEGVWTRDISYSIHLAHALIMPRTAERSLRAKVDQHLEVIQDTGTGGSWPVSTDRVVWALAAWELYLARGNRRWLAWSCEVLRRTAERDRHVAFDWRSGLYHGETTFLDWREQSYPPWMDSVAIFDARALGTNVLHYSLLSRLARMTRALGRSADEAGAWEHQAATLRSAINRKLWLEETGRYGAFLYPPLHGTVSDTADSLGLALAVLEGVAGPGRAARVVAGTPVVPYGVPCIWPQQAHATPYHNRAVWPFVTAYHAWAAAEVGHDRAVWHAASAIIRAAALFLTNKENLVADSGDSRGTAVNSDRQLWSVAGYLALVYRVLFGVRLDEGGLFFRPMVPKQVRTPLTLHRFPLGGAELEIVLRGNGSHIRELRVDGAVRPADHRLPLTLRGRHRVVIEVEGAAAGRIDLRPAGTTAPAPVSVSAETAPDGSAITLRWEPVPGAARYRVYRDGRPLAWTTAARFRDILSGPLDQLPARRYTVRAVSARGLPSRFGPVALVGVTRRHAPLNPPGPGAVRLRPGSEPLRFAVNVLQPGEYLLRFRYANGAGPVNTGNSCAIRSLFLDGTDTATVVLPQRGSWSSWGMSNALILPLERGRHQVELRYDEGDRNMNGATNIALVDQLKVTRLR